MSIGGADLAPFAAGRSIAVLDPIPHILQEFLGIDLAVPGSLPILTTISGSAPIALHIRTNSSTP